VTSSVRRRSPEGGRRPTPALGWAALAVPGGVLQGSLIGLHIAVLDTLAQASALRGSGFESWFGFAVVEVIIAVGVGAVAGGFIGLIVSGVLALAWAAGLGAAATCVFGAVTVSLASTVLLVVWFGTSGQLFSFATYAAVRGAGGVIVLVWLAERSQGGGADGRADRGAGGTSGAGGAGSRTRAVAP